MGVTGAVFGESVLVVGSRCSIVSGGVLPFVLSRPAGTGAAAAVSRLRGAVQRDCVCVRLVVETSVRVCSLFSVAWCPVEWQSTVQRVEC